MDLPAFSILLNLPRRLDRFAAAAKRLSEARISARHFPAFDAERLAGDAGNFASPGGRAHSISFRHAIRTAARQNAPALFIIEDDAHFATDFRARAAALAVPDDWQLFYFGCLHIDRPEVVAPGVVRCRKAFDTHAVVIRDTAFATVRKIIAARGRKAPVHTDVLMAELHETLPAYAAFPNLAWQEDGASDITPGRICNYDAQGRQLHCPDAVRNL